MPNRLIIFASSKGGVGKSYASRVFIDLARRAERRVSAWDLDGGTGSMALLYLDRHAEVGTGTEDVRDPKAPAAWLDAVYGNAEDVVLDVPGGALESLVRVLDGGASALIAEAKAAKREVVVVSVIGIKRDATGSPQEAIELFGTDVHHVVLKNGYFGTAEDFVIFDGLSMPTLEDPLARKYGNTSRVVAEAGGEVLYLPKLNPITDALLDVESLTFMQAIEALSILGRRHTANIRSWLTAADIALSNSWLCPNGSTPSTVRSHLTATIG